MRVSPQEYFEVFDFSESLVGRIVYESGLDRLEFVLAYMGHDGIIVGDPGSRQPSSQDAPWDFRRLLFCHVTQLRRDECRYKRGFRGFDPADFSFSPEKTPLTPCIESAHVRRIRDARATKERCRATINMGSFGSYCFDFGCLLADQRLVRTVPVSKDKSDHFDYHTGVKVDYDNPFPADYAVSMCPEAD